MLQFAMVFVHDAFIVMIVFVQHVLGVGSWGGGLGEGGLHPEYWEELARVLHPSLAKWLGNR